MKYLKKLKVELDNLANSLGRTATSHFTYDQDKPGTRARLLQSMIALLKLVVALDAEWKEWNPDNTGEWAKFLNKLEKWILNRPAPDGSTALPGYHEMLLDLCSHLHIPGTPTFDQAIIFLEKELETLGKLKMLMLTHNEGTVAQRLVEVQKILGIEGSYISNPKPPLPTYHEILNYICSEFGIPGSPDFVEAVKWIKERGLK